MPVVLILLYSILGSIEVRPFPDTMGHCILEASSHLGETLSVIDSGFYQSGPPKVIAAFCAYGVAATEGNWK